MGKYTFLPPYFLNSFVTLLAERGLLGLVIICLLITTTIRLIRKRNSGDNTCCESVGFCLLTGLLSCIFYEALNCYLLVFVIAIAFMLNKTEKADERRVVSK